MSGRYLVYTDGASRGNPGAAAIGAALYRIDDGEPVLVETVAEAIGIATNNEAEYRAVIAGLEAAVRHEADAVEVRADSLLLVKQLNGEYRVKSPGLKPFHGEAKALLERIPETKVCHVRRELNTEADALANAALDA